MATDETLVRAYLARLRELNNDEVRLTNEVREAQERVSHLRYKRDALKQFLQRELADLKLAWALREYQQIFDPASGNGAVAPTNNNVLPLGDDDETENEEQEEEVGETKNKTHIILALLRSHSDGLFPAQIVTLANDVYETEISPAYIYTTLGKLIKRGLAGKNRRDAYVATQAGREYPLTV